MRMKKLFSILMILIVVWVMVPQMFMAQGSMPVYINGVKVALPADQQPYLNKTNRTMISIRGLSDYLGYTVNWNTAKKIVEIKHAGNTIILPVNDLTVTVNGKKVVLDAKTEMVNGRVFVPLRFVSQTLGSDVAYNSQTKVVEIKKKKESAPLVTPTPTPTVNVNNYVVKSGDTLFSVSKAFGVTIAQLKEWNGLKEDTLIVGQSLRVAKEVVHVVVSGDTLYKLAAQYKVEVDAIRTKNGLKNDTLLIGQKVIIPNASAIPVSDQNTIPTPAPTPMKEEAVVRVEGSLNVRKGPSTSYGIITSLSNGTVVDVVETNGSWKKIVYGNKEGWVDGSYLVMGKAIESPIVATGVLKGKIIVIDPGHGGNDSGTIGIDGTTYEKTLALSYSKEMEAQLKALGATVYMTRTADTRCGGVWAASTNDDLKCRTNFAAQKKADIFVSVHFNSTYGATGTETFYNSTNNYDGNVNPYPADSKRLAELIHKYYRPAVNLPDRQVKNANYYVNRMAKMPSVLMEIGFLSNKQDLARVKLDSVKKQVAIGVAKGIQEYFSK